MSDGGNEGNHPEDWAPHDYTDGRRPGDEERHQIGSSEDPVHPKHVDTAAPRARAGGRVELRRADRWASRPG